MPAYTRAVATTAGTRKAVFVRRQEACRPRGGSARHCSHIAVAAAAAAARSGGRRARRWGISGTGGLRAHEAAVGAVAAVRLAVQALLCCK